MEYISRIVDDVIDRKTEAFNAVSITGPKGCGKTRTARERCKTVIEFQDATREIMGQLMAGQTIGVVVGPEGGFAPEEIALVDEHATMHRISLGRRILRTETAGLAALAMLVYNLDV